MTNNSLANELAIHFTRREKALESELKMFKSKTHLQKIMPMTGPNIEACLIFVQISLFL